MWYFVVGLLLAAVLGYAASRTAISKFFVDRFVHPNSLPGALREPFKHALVTEDLAPLIGALEGAPDGLRPTLYWRMRLHVPPQALAKWLKKRPEDVTAWVLKAGTDLDQAVTLDGAITAPLAEGSRSTRFVNDALQACEEALSRAPGHPEALRLQTDAHRLLGRKVDVDAVWQRSTDPHHLGLAHALLQTLRPEWGGSHKAMVRFARPLAKGDGSPLNGLVPITALYGGDWGSAHPVFDAFSRLTTSTDGPDRAVAAEAFAVWFHQNGHSPHVSSAFALCDDRITPDWWGPGALDKVEEARKKAAEADRVLTA